MSGRPDRHTAIILLERTLTDFDYQPKTATGAIVRQAGRGEGPTTTIVCRSCGGEGERRIRTILHTCERCGGRGVEVVDAYTERKVRTEEQEGEQHKRMVRCSSCGGTKRGPWWRNGEELTNTCRRCWGSGYEPAPSAPVRPWRTSTLSAQADTFSAGDPVLACMERRVLAGSYEELGLALAALRLEHQPLYRINVCVFVEGEREEEHLDRFEAAMLDESLGYLDSLMPIEIRVPSWAARYEERRRNRVQSHREEAAA